MKRNPVHLMRCITLLLISGVCLAGCVSFEKVADLTYGRITGTKGGSGEVYLAKTVVEQPFPRLPGGRVVLGTVKDSVTQIVTSGDISRWIVSALMEELYSAGYEVRTVDSLPQKVTRGVLVRIVHLSSNQDSDGLVLRTSTEIDLAAEMWRAGRLAKTLTVSASSQDEGIDRSGAVVTSSLRATLQSAFGQLMPGIISTLGR
jgi:hypothetical protein